MIFHNPLNVLAGVNVRCITGTLKCPIFLAVSKYVRKDTSFSTICQVQNHGSVFIRRCQSTQKTSNKSAITTLSEVKETSGQVTIGEKVKQTTKDAYYTGIVIAGIAVTGIMFYTIFRELFSKQSPNGIYTDALKLCKENNKVMDALGEPIKGHGETTSRGRRRHVSHVEFEKDGVKCMRMRFYAQGSRRRGTVHLEVQKNEKSKYEYRYLFVELDGYPRETIILLDNR